jgi:hypothetical protein
LPNISNLLLPASTVALALTPVGNIALALVLFVAADLAIAVFIARTLAARRKTTENSIVMLDRDMPMHLLRRTEPALRAHRPIGVVEMQVRWRHAAEAHRRTREKSWQGR